MTPTDLKALRTKRGWTQHDLAERIGVDRNTVARWEQGVHPIPTMVEKLCRMMDGKRRTK